ncbi:MAG TPA: hypothetical protein PJ982_17220 [Lacipirellulaceae bacterium]|nr:hypothetical protein [Lacipirellulaceae bacterium]
MRCRLLSTIAALAVVAAGSNASAAILLSDTFADGDRTNTNLPTESAVYASAPAAVTMANGSLSYAQSTGSRRLHTYFTPATPVTLGVGDRLLATVDFIPKGALYDATSRNFRFGLFSDPTGARVTVDSAGDAGTGNTWEDAQGYSVFMPLSAGPTTTQQFQINKRVTTTGNLMGSGANHVAAPSGGGELTFSLDTLYTLTLEVHKVSATQSDVTIQLLNGATVLASQTVSDNGTDLGAGAPYDNFDMMAFRFSAASATADVLEFRRLQVELIPIPEPTSCGLALFSALALAAARRRA